MSETKKWKIKPLRDSAYDCAVEETNTEVGKRLDAYSSSPDKVFTEEVFRGSLSDCYAWIQSRKEGLL